MKPPRAPELPKRLVPNGIRLNRRIDRFSARYDNPPPKSWSAAFAGMSTGGEIRNRDRVSSRVSSWIIARAAAIVARAIRIAFGVSIAQHHSVTAFFRCHQKLRTQNAAGS
jgi:hypothetical protein